MIKGRSASLPHPKSDTMIDKDVLDRPLSHPEWNEEMVLAVTREDKGKTIVLTDVAAVNQRSFGLYASPYWWANMGR